MIKLFGVRCSFYIQYKNVKPDVSNSVMDFSQIGADFCYSFQYLNAIWNVINFNEAENRINVRFLKSK